MKKNHFFLLLFNIFTIILAPIAGSTTLIESMNDFDPLTDTQITFHLEEIRSFEKNDNQVNFKEYIDRYSDPDFYVIVIINNVSYKSQIWRNTKYVYNPNWSVTVDVPDDVETVNIKIQLWDWNIGLNQLCDISPDRSVLKDGFDAEITYSIKYGFWMGDDHNENNEDPIKTDLSGYGRLNGCDDGSIYQHERDCELLFSITQNDIDNDGIPYWSELNILHTDPLVDNRGEDDDLDLIPLEWEFKYGLQLYKNRYSDSVRYELNYDPFTYEDHMSLDPDNDGLTNYQEFLTSQWGSDPFRKDLFVELDEMQDSPDGGSIELPDSSKELLRTAYNRRNIVYHLDDGCMGGGEKIPYDELSSYDELNDMYEQYFLHDNEDNWRKGVFHYGLVVNEAEGAYGFVFRRDAYQISKVGMVKKVRDPFAGREDVVYASAYMHECGHTLGIFNSNTPGCDDQVGKYPWQVNWWKWLPYKSVMNYGYMYRIVDYSDGSRGKNDFNDWERLDLTFFQTDW